jgi:transcriptional regulator with XRE-family HTH domain
MEATAKQVAAILGPRIRRIRRGLDMSQENLADNAQVHRTQITAIEWGEQLLRIDTLIRLAAGSVSRPARSSMASSGRSAEAGRAGWSRRVRTPMPEIPQPSRRFAANMRRLHEEAGFTQEELAFRSAIHRPQISLLEGGKRMPRVFTLVCLAGSLVVTPNDLLDGIAWEPIVSISGGLVVTPAEGDGGG